MVKSWVLQAPIIRKNTVRNITPGQMLPVCLKKNLLKYAAIASNGIWKRTHMMGIHSAPHMGTRFAIRVPYCTANTIRPPSVWLRMQTATLALSFIVDNIFLSKLDALNTECSITIMASCANSKLTVVVGSPQVSLPSLSLIQEDDLKKLPGLSKSELLEISNIISAVRFYYKESFNIETEPFATGGRVKIMIPAMHNHLGE